MTFVSSILHYVDNILFFAHYPEPDWINPQIVDLFWFVMTPLAPLGFYLIKKRTASYRNIFADSLRDLQYAYSGACDVKS